jgi:hypothetical protein
MEQTVKTPVGDAPVIPLVLLGAGLYLAWFGIHYWRADVRWPTDPVKSVLTGHPIPEAHHAQPASAVLTAEIQSANTGSADASSGSSSSGAPTAQGTYDEAGLARLWVQCGGASSTAAFAAKVAMAESSGRADVTSRNPDGGTNVGLWQLDTRGVGVGHTIAELQDPVTNCRITILATGNGHNWTAWGDPVTAAVGHHV